MAFSGQRLRALRTQRGDSLRAVAAAIGASKAHIWELETGHSCNPTSELLIRLARHFDVSVGYLVGEDPNASEEDFQYVAMFREFKKLSERDRRVIDALMRSMRKQA